jgi:Tol biopolymer transport system component
MRSSAASPADEAGRSPGGNFPRWSPDGGALVVGRGVGSTDSAIVVVTLDGERRTLFAPPPGGLAAFPTFSADGHTVVFQLQVEGESRQIWTIPAAGGEARRLSRGDVEYSHPQTTPSRPDDILVVVDHRNLALVSATTGETTLLTDVADSTQLVDYPSWSPDGSKIYFSISRKLGDLFLLENPPPTAGD